MRAFDESNRSTPRDWSVVAMVAAAAGVAQTFGRFTFSLLFNDIRDDFGLSNTLTGGLGSINLAAYLVATVAVTATVNRVGLLKMTRIGLAASVTGIAVLAWSPTLEAVTTGQIITGLGGAAVWITAPALAANRLGSKRRGLAIGAASTGIGVAIVLASAIDSWTAAGGWRAVYAIQAVIACAVVMAVLGIVDDETAMASPVTRRSTRETLALIPGAKHILGAYALYGLALALFLTFLVASLEDDAGYSAGAAALAFTIFGVGTVFGGPTFGPLSDKLGRERALVTAFTLMTAASLLVPTGTRPWPWIAAFAFGASFTGIPTIVAAFLRDHVDGPSFGAAFGAATLAFGAAMAVGPQLGGALADAATTFTPVFVLAAIAAAAGGTLIKSLSPSNRS